MLAFVTLLWSTMRDGTEYFKNIDEVSADQSQWHGKQLQLPATSCRDRFCASPIRSTTSSRSRTIRSATANPGLSSKPGIRALFPTRFKGEAEVVLKGRLASDGFHTDRDGVMAKCPSKYEAMSSASTGS